MPLDSPTLFLVLICTLGMLAVSLKATLGLQLPAGQRPGLQDWTSGLLLVAIGFALRLYVPVLPEAWAVVGGIGLVSLGFGFMWRAMRLFHAVPARWTGVVVPAALLTAEQLVFLDHGGVRVVFVCLVFGLQLYAVARAAMPAGAQHFGRSQWVFGGTVLAIAVALLGRGVYGAFVDASAVRPTSDHVANGFSVLLCVLGGLLANFALLAMYLERAAAHQRAVADLDPLTGALNRRALWSAAEAAIGRARLHGGALAVAMIDIDHFKQVNDQHGHLVGDQIIDAVCRSARTALRSGDTLTRFGGDELLLLLPDTALATAVEVAERIRTRLRHEALPVATLRVTLTIGVAEWESGERSLDAAIARADRALYAAKAAGRDRVLAGAGD